MRMIQRDDYHFHVIKGISDKSFSGVEIPPEANLRYQYDHTEIFVREVNQRIVAYAMVVLDAGTGGPYIWSIATEEKHRGCGYAGGLLTEIIEWANAGHYAYIELTVNVNNPAQKLYFDHGFRVTQVLKRYYGEFTGLRMRRKLI